MLWYGSIASIPSGWALCDGNNNTPNLVNRFIRGAGVGAGVDVTGGNTSHSHPFTGDGHGHDLAGGDDIANVSPAGDWLHNTTSSPATGDTDSVDGRPPFHTLCYIMKLPIP